MVALPTNEPSNSPMVLSDRLTAAIRTAASSGDRPAYSSPAS
jgi:hypothetical protein